LALTLADKHQQQSPCNLPTNSINPSLAIPLCQFFSLQQSSLQQFLFGQKLLQSKTPIQKASLHQKGLCPPSASLLYPVVRKEVEQQFLGEGV
jgi:hypothetical protein